MTIIITRPGHLGKVGIIGVIAESPRGFRFISKTTVHGNGRVYRETARAAIPKWVRHAYLVKAENAAEAIRLTNAYRIGHQWATDAAGRGDIDIIR
jgi:hypothetical protein|tara:strand:+ start:536 stop:823 length:288 start_codon:yes stop_codon:yes gene_type:complete